MKCYVKSLYIIKDVKNIMKIDVKSIFNNVMKNFLNFCLIS